VSDHQHDSGGSGGLGLAVVLAGLVAVGGLLLPTSAAPAASSEASGLPEAALGPIQASEWDQLPLAAVRAANHSQRHLLGNLEGVGTERTLSHPPRGLVYVFETRFSLLETSHAFRDRYRVTLSSPERIMLLGSVEAAPGQVLPPSMAMVRSGFGLDLGAFDEEALVAAGPYQAQAAIKVDTPAGAFDVRRVTCEEEIPLGGKLEAFTVIVDYTLDHPVPVRAQLQGLDLPLNATVELVAIEVPPAIERED
jgi:hypothetical protein